MHGCLHTALAIEHLRRHNMKLWLGRAVRINHLVIWQVRPLLLRTGLLKLAGIEQACIVLRRLLSDAYRLQRFVVRQGLDRRV